MNAHKTSPKLSLGFRYAYTILGLMLGLALGSLIYAVTGQIEHLIATMAFGLVAGAGVDGGNEGREYPGDDPFK